MDDKSSEQTIFGESPDADYKFRYIDTREGEMIKIEEERNKSQGLTYYVKTNTIVGFKTFIRKRENSWDKDKRVFFLVTSITQGRGINGVDSCIEVTERCFNAVVEHFSRVLRA